MTDLVKEDRFYWRNLRTLSACVGVNFWPLEVAFQREEDLSGGKIVVVFGPLLLMIYYGIGNCSSETWWGRAGGLSQTEAYDRAERAELRRRGRAT